MNEVSKKPAYAKSRTTRFVKITANYREFRPFLNLSRSFLCIYITQFKQIMHIKVYVAEAEGIPEYGTTTTLGKRLVAVKFLLPEASEKEK